MYGFEGALYFYSIKLSVGSFYIYCVYFLFVFDERKICMYVMYALEANRREFMLEIIIYKEYSLRDGLVFVSVHFCECL